MQVFKVAREMGPSVIYLDEAEKASERRQHYVNMTLAHGIGHTISRESATVSCGRSRAPSHPL